MYNKVNESDIINFRDAEENDVDLLLDMKLDIILNNEETLEMNKNELEKIVLEAEEEIRKNLTAYKIILKDEQEIGVLSVVDYGEAKLIDLIYIMNKYRNKGIGRYTVKKIIQDNYKSLFLWVNKSNNILISLCKNIGFNIEEELENKFYLKYENNKEENRKIKAKMLCTEVSKLCEKYKIDFYFYTPEYSISNMNENELKKIKERK